MTLNSLLSLTPGTQSTKCCFVISEADWSREKNRSFIHSCCIPKKYSHFSPADGGNALSLQAANKQQKKNKVVMKKKQTKKKEGGCQYVVTCSAGLRTASGSAIAPARDFRFSDKI